MTSDPGCGYDAVWINGSVGAGKSTTAEALAAVLERRGVPGALIDVDALRRRWPTSRADPFSTSVATQNLRAVSSTFRAHGAEVMVVAGVIEDPEDVARQTAALSAQRLLLVRLVVDPAVAARRLDARHPDDAERRAWHRRRHPELAAVLAGVGFADELVLDTTVESPQLVAERIAEALRAV